MKNSYCNRFRYWIPLLFLLLFIDSWATENWPSYEGNFHQSSSSVNVDPSTIRLKWVRRFDELVHMNDDRSWNYPDIGTFYSRNLSLYEGKIGLCATTTTNDLENVASITVLDAGNGNILNCVGTNQRYGPYKSQFDACDTAMGEQVVAWDSDTGYFFISIGGDQPARHALDLMNNAGSYSGNVQTAVGAYESLATAWPDIRSSRTQNQSTADETTNPRLKRSECPGSDTANPPQLPDEFPSGSISSPGGPGPSNKAGFVEIQTGSDYIANDRNHSHNGVTGITLSNKRTGLTASRDWYQSNDTDLGWPVFKMWGGTLCDKDRVYYMGGYALSDPAGGPVGSNVGGKYKGLRIASLKFENQNLGTNDGGYTGLGMNETAVKTQEIFEYTLDSTDIGNSWYETDNTYRNKAMLVENDNLWVAWKPGVDDPVQLVKANSSGINTYNLSVGSGMKGWEIWPNIAFSKVGSTSYIVYALFNAKTSSVSAPTGPASITVFDASTGSEKWSFELNNEAQTGNYPDFRPHSHELYNELARMVIAGKYAYVAWVDASTGPNLKLKVIAFDITANSSPTVAPTPFVYDLGVPLNASAKDSSPGGGLGNLASRVTDMMAADGTLYILLNESCDLLRPGHVYAQQVIALTSDGAIPVLTSLEVTPSNAVVLTGDTQQFSAIAKDQFGVAMNPQPPISWSFNGNSSNGNINSSGLFLAGNVAGGPFTVTANSGGVNGFASTTVQTGFVVNLQEGSDNYVGTADTYLDQYSPTSNNGAANRLNCDFVNGSENEHVLIRFDLGSIPTNAIIQSATLNFTVTRAVDHDASDVILIGKVTSSWNENHTWNDGIPLFSPSGIISPSVAGYSTGQVYAITGVSNLVQEWVQNSGSNHGMIFYNTTTKLNFRWGSSEHSALNWRPQLQVQYTLPTSNPDSDGDGLPDSWENNYFSSLIQDGAGDVDGDGQTNLEEYSSGTNPVDKGSRLYMLGAAISGNNFTINWQSVSGMVYQVEYSLNLSNWNTATSVQANSPSTYWIDDGTLTGSSVSTTSRRFYRVKIP